MTKISDLPENEKIPSDSYFIIDGKTSGTNKISAKDMPYILFDEIPEMHSNIYGGRNLGTTVTSTQMTAIRSGKFNGLYVGDYWIFNGRIWRIVDFDYFYGFRTRTHGSNDQHHVVVMPDVPLGTARFHNDNRTWQTGFANSEIGKIMLDSAQPTAASYPYIDWWNKLYQDTNQYYIPFTSVAESGLYSDSNVYSELTADRYRCILPSVHMLFSNEITAIGHVNRNTWTNADTYAISPFALYRMNPRFLTINAITTGSDYSGTYWLSNAVGNDCALCMSYTGKDTRKPSSVDANVGVRPVVCIG